MLMKVICIDNKPHNEGKTHKGKKSYSYLLREGKLYTVEMVYENGYDLIELPHPYSDCIWSKNRFIPLSDIDETEMVREKVNHPTLELVKVL